MAPLLYGTVLSPPVRAVLFTEAALGIKIDYRHVDTFAAEHLKPEFVKLNPQHTVPLLVDDDGTIVADSHAIMAYLVGKYGKDDKLYPKDLARRADVDHKLHFESGCIFSLARRIMFKIGSEGVKKVDDTCLKLAEENFDFLNKFLEGRKWVSGDAITIADFSLVTTVTALNILVPIDPKFTNVHNWIKRAEALPYYNINEKGLAQLRELLENFKPRS